MTSFEAWYAGYHPVLVAALTVVATDTEAASDAAAEAFVRALERWPQVEAMVSPEGWTYQVAINVLRRRARRARLEFRARPPGVGSEAPPQLAPEVWAAVRALPLRQRQAIALRYVIDLSEQEVADVMGVALGTASATLVAARRALAAALTEDASLETA